MTPRDPLKATLALILVMLLVRLWAAASVGPASDEAYYWEWSRHLAWGYFDHPPMIAYVIALGTQFAGVTAFGVRLVPMLMSVATLWFVYRIATIASGDPRAGWWAALLLSVVPLYAVAAWLATPDAPMAFFWSLAVWLTMEALVRGRAWLWLGAGAAVGLTIVSKYTGVALAVSLLVALLGWPGGRASLRQPAALAGIGLIILCGLPMLAWNLERGMPSVTYQLAHGFGVGDQHAWYATLFEFLGSQAGVLTPFLCGLTFWVLGHAVLRARAVTPAGALEGGNRLLWMPAVLTLAVFTLASAFGDSEANWAAPAYLTAFALLGAHMPRLWDHGLRRVRIVARLSLWLPLALSAYMLVEAAYPLVPYTSGPFEDVRDRSQLAGWVQQLRESDPVPDAALLARGHQLASMLAFVLPDHPAVGAPTVSGSGSSYHEWRSPVCDSREAWFFTARPKQRELETVFSEYTSRGQLEELRRGVVVKRVHAFRGIARAELCQQ